MTEMIYKVLEDCEVKKLGERQYEFIASTSDIDRDGEVIDVKGWDLKNFKKNPVIMYAHDYRTLPIGKALRVWISEGKLKNTIEFPPEGTYEFADIVERLVDTGYLKTESVGFIPGEWVDAEDDKLPRRKFTKQELLEISIVPVPSNPEALRNALDNGVITTKEMETITKPEETDDYIRLPVAECNVTATIDISKKEGIKALYCGKEKKVRTYLFDKRDPYNWTMAKAKKWVEDHKEEKQETYECECIKCGHKVESEKHCKDIKCPECGGEMRRVERPGPGQEGVDKSKGGTITGVGEEHPQEREMSQAGIMDELDYLIRLVETEGMNGDTKRDSWNLVREVMRLTGGDIPDDILAKIGAVLSSKNKGNLKQAQTLIQTVLDSAASEQESIEDVPVKATKEEIITEVVLQVKAYIDGLRGKVS